MLEFDHSHLKDIMTQNLRIVGFMAALISCPLLKFSSCCQRVAFPIEVKGKAK